MSTLTARSTSLPVTIALRAGISLTLAISGLIHAELYAHGYRYIPTIGPAFLVQASVFVALAILIAVGGPQWLTWVAGLGAAGSLVAFALSRTVGIAGFTEHGLAPAPQALIQRDRRGTHRRALCRSGIYAAASSCLKIVDPPEDLRLDVRRSRSTWCRYRRARCTPDTG